MEQIQPNRVKFRLGCLVTTPGAVAALDPEDVQRALCRHLHGDWGDVCKADWEENDLSLREGFRILSVYHDRQGVKFWIITEADRTATTILLPDEY